MVVRFEYVYASHRNKYSHHNTMNSARNIEKLNDVEEKYNAASEECCAHLNKAWSQRHVSINIIPSFALSS